MSKWIWPLVGGNPMWPDEKGVYAAKRKFDIHTGIDLYTEPNTAVVAVEKGVIVAFEEYTGSKADSPWWNDTQAIFVKGESGVICYGEIKIAEHLKVGDTVHQGELLGEVLTVLKKDKGRPMTMLHFELYTPETTESVIWELGKEKPSNLLNPTEKLWNTFKAQSGKKSIYKFEDKNMSKQVNQVKDALGNVLSAGDKVMYYGYSSKPVTMRVNRLGAKRAQVSTMTQRAGRDFVMSMRGYWNKDHKLNSWLTAELLQSFRDRWDNENANNYHLRNGSWVTSARIIKVQ